MPEITQPGTLPVDEALALAVIQAWDNFSAAAIPQAIRVEYLSEPGFLVVQLTVWIVTTGGYQERICDYRAATATSRPHEWRCWTRLHSPRLTAAMDFIVRNQERFFRPAPAIPNGLVVVFPPTDEERGEAAAWAANSDLTSRYAVPRARAASFA